MTSSAARPRVTFHAAPRKAWRFVGLSAIVGILCLVSIFRPHASPGPVSLGFYWGATVTFFLLTIAHGASAIRGFPKLTVDAEGFILDSGFLSRRTSWTECERFEPSVGAVRGVAISYSNQFRPANWISRLCLFLTRRKGVIPDQFEISPEELCNALTDQRRAAVALASN